MGLPKKIRTRIVHRVEAFVHHLLVDVFKAEDSAPLAIEAILEADSPDPGPKAVCMEDPAKWTLQEIARKAALIQNGLMPTIHSYTGDQRLLDLPHKDLRRARAAALSMIPSSTGAAKAVALVLPDLDGKLNGLAIRVPTPNVSLVDFVATLSETVTVSEVNAVLKEASRGELKSIMGFSELPLVSSDYNGSPLSSVVDGPTTYVAGKMVKVLAWYDNETGYSNRMVDLAVMMAGA
jgi:glyceraldehyde-3-phosphate dehydrogenase type I